MSYSLSDSEHHPSQTNVLHGPDGTAAGLSPPSSSPGVNSPSASDILLKPTGATPGIGAFRVIDCKANGGSGWRKKLARVGRVRKAVSSPC